MIFYMNLARINDQVKIYLPYNFKMIVTIGFI